MRVGTENGVKWRKRVGNFLRITAVELGKVLYAIWMRGSQMQRARKKTNSGFRRYVVIYLIGLESHYAFFYIFH